MKHQVLFCLSTISFLSYSAQYNSNPVKRNAEEVADAFYAFACYKASDNGKDLKKISPEQLKDFFEIYNDILKRPLSNQDKNKRLGDIAKLMQDDGSLNDLLDWGDSHAAPSKLCQIR
jgi:hypothetical protein